MSNSYTDEKYKDLYKQICCLTNSVEDVFSDVEWDEDTTTLTFTREDGSTFDVLLTGVGGSDGNGIFTAGTGTVPTGNLAEIAGTFGFVRTNGDPLLTFDESSGVRLYSNNGVNNILVNNTATTISGPLVTSTINGNTFTTGTGTLTLAAGKTLTASNTITLVGTDGSTLNIGTGGTLGSNAYTSTAYLPKVGDTYTTTTGSGLALTTSTLTTGSLVSLTSTGTAAGSNTQTVLNIATSGTNATSAQTTYALDVSNTHAGTTSTNVAARFTASGGTNNYAIIVPSTGGDVGIGITAPIYKLHVSGNSGEIALGVENLGGDAGINFKGAAGARTIQRMYIGGATKWGYFVSDPTIGTDSWGLYDYTKGGFVLQGLANGDFSIVPGGKINLTPTLTSSSGVSITNSTVTSGNLLSITKTGTAALTGATGLNISFSGANATGAQTTYGLQASNTSTGTSTNIGGYFIANGGTNNYPLVAEGGFGAGGLTFGGRSATDGAIWSRAVTPTTNNYALTTTGGNTVVNGTSGVFIAINNLTNAISTSATNVAIGVAPTTGDGFSFANTTLTTGNLMSLSSTSTANTGTSATILNISKSGTHAASSVTSYGAQISNTSAGTSSINYGIAATATGATNNVAIQANTSSTGTFFSGEVSAAFRVALTSAAAGGAISWGNASVSNSLNTGASNVGGTLSNSIAGTLLSWNNGGQVTFLANGALSAPAISGTGTWITGGTGTTTKPYFLLEPSTVTTTNNWSTSGTGIGINAEAAFTGYFINFQLNAASKFYVDYVGNTAGRTASFVSDGNAFGSTTITTSTTTPLVIGGAGTTSTLTLQSTSGVGASDAIIFKVGNNGATESFRVITSGRIVANNLLRLKGYTFATLPASPVQGEKAFITDSPDAPAFMSDAAGGGSAFAPVMYEGTKWIVC